MTFKTRRGFSVVIVCGLLLTACSVGPKYRKPIASVPTAYKEPPPDTYKEGGFWNEAKPCDTLPRGKWWEVFQDPELNALEEQVDISNQNIAAAEAQFRNARAAITVTRANLFPNVTVNPTVVVSKGASNRVLNGTDVSGGGAGVR